MHNKIVFSGHPNSGKSRAIKVISDSFVVSTEARTTDSLALKKERTTVAMDYGILNLKNGERVHLYGAPGQERFRFMWPILTKNSLGMIILVDNSLDNAVEELDFYMQEFKQFSQTRRLAIGVTHCDIGPPLKLEEYKQLFKRHSVNPPILEVDARVGEDVKAVLKALMLGLQYKDSAYA